MSDLPTQYFQLKFTHLTWNKLKAHSAQLKGLLASWLATGLPVPVQLAKNKQIPFDN